MTLPVWRVSETVDLSACSFRAEQRDYGVRQTEGIPLAQPLTTGAFPLPLCRVVGLFKRCGVSLAGADNC